MTTIVVHGTLAQGANWYANSWHDGGFLHSLSSGMDEAAGWHDIWLAGAYDLSQTPQNTIKDDALLTGYFMWAGLPDGQSRGLGAVFLAQYLNKLRQITSEPIRIIAHSHGCNVVKLASSLPELHPDVYIDGAVFLACPHFYEDVYTQDVPDNWLDRLDISKIKTRKSGHRHRYKLAPERFGKILNIYTQSDEVQVNLAETFSGGSVPLTGGFWQNVKDQFSTGAFEQPKAARTETDQSAMYLYENLQVTMRADCGGIASHSAMHGAAIGELCGKWLNTAIDIQAIMDQQRSFQPINCDDNGE